MKAMKRIFPLLMVVALLLTCFPAAAFAANTGEPAETVPRQTEGTTVPETTAPVVTEAETEPKETEPPTEAATEPKETEPPTEAATEPKETEPPAEAATEPKETVPPTEAATEPKVTEPPTEAATGPKETEPPTEAATEPQETEPPTEAATEPEATEAPTEPVTEPKETEPEETEPPTEPEETEPEEPAWVRMEAEEYANRHFYGKVPIANGSASNGYVVGSPMVLSVYALDPFDDLAASELTYTPYVKFNVTADEAGTYEVHIGASLKGVGGDFYIPVLVDGRAYQARSEQTTGICEFTLTVRLAAGRNEILCLPFDADTYLPLLGGDVEAVPDATVDFDYLDIPAGVQPLPKDAQDPVEAELPAGGDDGDTPNNLDNSGESGSGTGSGTGGGTTQPGQGTLLYYSIGVTMQVVTYPYGETWNRNNSWQNVVNTAKSPGSTVYSGKNVSAVFVGDSHTGRIFKLANASKAGSFRVLYHNKTIIDPRYTPCVSGCTYDAGSNTIKMNVPNAVEQFLSRVIWGSSLGAWDTHNVAIDASGNSLADNPNATGAMDKSVFAQVLRYLGVSETLIDNYVKGYSGQLDTVADYNVPIPTIIWSYVVVESNSSTMQPDDNSTRFVNYSGSGDVVNQDGSYDKALGMPYNDIYCAYKYNVIQPGDLFTYGYGDSSVYNTWWGKSFATPSACISNINGSCKWGSGDSFACTLALGPHGAHTMLGGAPMTTYMNGSGPINFLNADGVDKSDGNHFYFRGYWTPYGDVREVTDRPITLQKSINASQACIDQIKGNAMYSLAGAKYEISVNGQVVETLVTDQDGKAASAQKYKVGTVLTIREIAAPAGFKLDTTVYTHKVTADQNLIAVKDEPIFDPPFAITKVDRDTTKPQGNGSFSGAVFKWEYFANESWSGTPVRTWYFQTNANGAVGYRPSYLASGYTSDALFYDDKGTPNMPLGTVKIMEIKNSLGYIVLPQPLFCSIVEDPSSLYGANVVWNNDSQNFILDMIDGNYGVYEPIDTDAFGSLTIQKLDRDFGTTAPTWATLAGCEFTVYNRSANAVKIGDAIVKPGEVCCTLTVDSTGKASTGNIFPIGCYEVRESKGNEYYQCNEDWSFTFTVTGEEAHQAFTAQCPNTMYPGAIHLQKFGTDGKPMPGAKFLLEWSTDGSSWTPVAKSADIVMGGCSSPELDDDGCLTIGADGTADFTGLYPAVQYRITEVEAPNGYQLLKEPILVPELLPEKNFECAYRVVNNDMFTLPKTGLSGTWMYGVAGIALMAIGCAPVLLATRRKRYRE